MRKKVTIITLALVLIGLIFFAFVLFPKEEKFEGVLVQTEYEDGRQTG